VLSSANTVFALRSRLDMLSLTVSTLAGLSVAAVGPATAEAARDLLGLESAMLPETFSAEGLAQRLQLSPGARVWLPQADIGRETLSAALTEAGAQVTVVTAYRTVCGTGGVELPGLLVAGLVDCVTFTSPSTVQNCVQRLTNEGGSPALLASLALACIGSTTAQAVKDNGLQPTVIATNHTLPGLVDALEDYFRQEYIGYVAS